MGTRLDLQNTYENVPKAGHIFRRSTATTPRSNPHIAQEPEPEILSCIFSRFDKLYLTSSTLSVQRVPRESRQSISLRLADAEMISDDDFYSVSHDSAQDKGLWTEIRKTSYAR
jgi:hypothetical protein